MHSQIETMQNLNPQSNVNVLNCSSLSDNNSLTFSAKGVISDNLIGFLNNDIPGWLFSLLMEVTSYAMIAVAVFGLVGNIFILITYSKIGFSDSINISYCALSVSDIFCVVFMTWNGICFIPAFAASDIPFISSQIVIPTGGFPSDTFSKTTAWITAFISLERCMCVVFPLKIKSIAKAGRTVFVIIAIFTFTVLPLTSISLYTYTFHPRFHARKNKTLLGIKFRNTPLARFLDNARYMYTVVFMNFTPLAVIILCSIFLAVHLKRSASWRLENSGDTRKKTENSSTLDGRAQRRYEKDMRVAKTVLVIALTFLAAGLVTNVKIIMAMNLPEFRQLGTLSKWFQFISRLAFFLSMINSSVNFFIYYKMGTKFKKTFHEIFFRIKSM